MGEVFCDLCEVWMSREEIIDHEAAHCDQGEHCTAQDPGCGVDTGPGRDHEMPFTCCCCGRKVTLQED